MRYIALATDYDGTLATAGRVDDRTVEALQRLRESERRLILVTGRELGDLIEVFPHVDLFDWVVAENGALLYEPSTKEERVLGDPPPDTFRDALLEQGVPASFGRVIVGTRKPHETAVLEVIKKLGLELQLIFNQGAVMVLPVGLDKASGMVAALDEMHLSRHNVVGVGDAENDHAFLRLCECSVAVANALPSIKQTADIVTSGERGAGVIELVDRLLASDLKNTAPQIGRAVLLGIDDNDREVLFGGVCSGGPSAWENGPRSART